ncbi:hypothetical protein [Lusitaniella coriacea]|uniref:hypothetical protein n=1 Tax=Lusitaniella coriacea TaxID=1983105 RepID=UPI003CF283A2
MTSRTKNTTKSVSFSTTEGDQTLLSAIADRLESKAFKNFSDLCKTALEQYFLPSPPEPVAPFDETFISQHFHQIEEQLTALIEQTQSIAQKAIPSDSSDESMVLSRAIELLSSQFQDLGERVRKLEEKSAIDLESQLKVLEERIKKIETQQSPSLPNETVSQPKISEESDPLLHRLTPLLEEF